MALQLSKLTQQIDELGLTLATRAAEFATSVPAALAALRALEQTADSLTDKIQLAIGQRWAGAIPAGEPVAESFPPPLQPARLNVIAADGSQVYPDRHGLALFYLINIGSITFRHGLNEAPGCNSSPQVYFDAEDLYDGEQLVASAMIDAKRDIGELRELARLAQAESESAPTLALLDNGLLLYISLQVPNQRKIDEILRAYLGELDAVRASGAAVAGIVDRPRAATVVRLLRLATLDADDISEQTLRATSPFERVTDAMLFDFLQPGERSALFVNASPANLDQYQPAGHKIHFFYVNAGRPGHHAILRVEVPEWVATDRTLLNLVQAGVLEQCRLTGGFPYVLMRAHELAVVTVRERRNLESMVTGAMVRQGLSPTISRKAQGKAWTGGAKRRFRV